MIDYQTWRGTPPPYVDRPNHAHNRLISSVQMSAAERRRFAQVLGEKLRMPVGPSAFLLPLHGIEEWDRPGQPLHDPEGLAAFVDGLRQSVQGPTELVELSCHINDGGFVDAALGIFDRWVTEGRIPAGLPS
jgi:uncharacterized protein (UPF0261 family)